MKRWISVLLIMIMVVSMVACSKKEPPAPTFPSESESAGVSDPTGNSQSTDSTTSPTTPNDEPTDDDTELTAPSTDPVVIDPSVIDVSGAKETTSNENPAGFGEWIKSTRFAPATKTYETVYWRVINTSFDCQDDIDRYNSENHEYKFADIDEEKIEYCKVTYQVYFPEEFPANEKGVITSCILPLNCGNFKKGYIELDGVVYTGLGGVTDVTVDRTGKPGEVFTGEAIYLMVDDPDVEYGFWYMHRLSAEDEEYQFDYSECN